MAHDAYPADRLQNFPAPFLWAVADSALLQAINQSTPIQRGIAGRRLKTLVKFFRRLKLVYLLLFVVGLAAIFKFLWKQRNGPISKYKPHSGQPINQNPSCFFVGFGAGAEEALFAAYCAEKKAPVARIDQTQVGSMGCWQRVGVWPALASLIYSLGNARQAMALLPTEYSPWKNDFLTFVGIRLGYYSYVRAWFSQLKSSTADLAEVCFLAADTAAFAAVNAGLPTRHLQHGLIRHSLVLPTFATVDALTHDEMLHFRRRLPSATVRLTRPHSSPIEAGKPACILVASVYGHHGEMRRILPILEFAAERGLVIHVRPHPVEDRSFWQSIDFPFPVSLDDSDETFDAALARLRPVFVVSWYSTALVDALYRNVIPVTVSARDDRNIQDLVYPLFSHCLHWPSDQAEIAAIASNDLAYATTLHRLRAGMD